jgi:predicted O-methyltransferase YrrM
MVRPGYLEVMGAKLVSRVTDRRHASRSAAAVAWAETRAVQAGELAGRIDQDLWNEAVEFAHRLDVSARPKLEALDEDPGQGGGHTALLYFLVRHRRPEIVVETGVALGFSTAAILAALHANGAGHVYSSDFPAFKLRDPERHIGIVVGDDLRDRWTVYLRGDRRNLARILEEVGRIDLFHYDSDKTYGGRKRVLRRVQPRLARDAVVVMDDVQDNLFFHDYAERDDCPYEIVDYDDKFLGIVGLSDTSG